MYITRGLLGTPGWVLENEYPNYEDLEKAWRWILHLHNKNFEEIEDIEANEDREEMQSNDAIEEIKVNEDIEENEVNEDNN